MSTHDPFLRSLLVVVDRLIVFSVLAAILFGLLWDVASRRAFGLSTVQPFAALWRCLLGVASSAESTVAVLCASLALTSATILSSLLFRRWRGRAAVRGSHVRGPTLEE